MILKQVTKVSFSVCIHVSKIQEWTFNYDYEPRIDTSKAILFSGKKSHQLLKHVCLIFTIMYLGGKIKYMRINMYFFSKVITRHTFQTKSSCDDLHSDKTLSCHQMMKKVALTSGWLYHSNWPQL